jgi:predicted RNA-binding Zn-ribbon protein involved in translation (DUF1610 family)
MLNPSQGVGRDSCPKCGSADLNKIFNTNTNALDCTCKSCGFIFTLPPLDTPQ